MKKNLLLLRDLLEPYKAKIINTWLQHEKIFILINYMTVDKCNNTYYRTIKKKPFDVKSITLVKALMVKILPLKLVILIEYQNIKIFLQKTMFKVGLKKFLLLQKLKILSRGYMLLVTLTAQKFLERFTKNTCKKQFEKILELRK